MWRGLTIALIAACAGTPRVVEAPATIIVLEAGAEPRQRVRFELVAHVPERRERTLKARFSLKFVNSVLENGQRDVDAPTITVVDRIEVTGFTPTGDALVASEIVEASVGDDVVDPAVRNPFVASVDKLKGSREVWRMAPSGATFDHTLSRPDIAAVDRVASLLDQEAQATAVLPDVEIGVGARWQAHSRPKIGGAIWERTVTYTLRELASSTATIDADVVMTAASQPLSVEPRATTTLTSARSHAAMELTIPLHGLVPAGTVQSRTELNLSLVRNALRVTTTTGLELQLSIKPLRNHE